jgi:oligopeptidase B
MLDLEAHNAPSSEARLPRIHGYDARDYVVERRWALSRDGSSIPISIARHRDVAPDGSAPAVLFGYGAYGIVESTANTDLHRALLKNGTVCAIAHVRGGGELGPSWHEAARGATKAVSIDDYLACAHDLVEHGYTAPDRLAAWGGSAGGLLVCGAMVREPRLFCAVVAMVPFVDVLTALVASADGRDEFGDPYESPEAFAAVRAYCPYHNLVPDSYPAVFVSTALNDVRVGYWHALKWVAKLRAMRTDDRRTILLVSNWGGHLDAGRTTKRNAWAAALGFVANELAIGW